MDGDDLHATGRVTAVVGHRVGPLDGAIAGVVQRSVRHAVAEVGIRGSTCVYPLTVMLGFITFSITYRANVKGGVLIRDQ